MGSLSVFLSYSHTDKIVARRIVRSLTAHGIKVWFDDNELRIGAALTASIRTHIEKADILIVIASKSSVESHWVGMELNFAKDHDKTIIPIFIEPLSTQERFKNYLGLDANSPQSFAEALDNLIRDLYTSINCKVPPADRNVLTLQLRELAKEEPNLAPLILGYLDSIGLHQENSDTVYGVTFHALDNALDFLFALYPREDIAICAAYGFYKAGAGTKALSSWIRITENGGVALAIALNQTLTPKLIPTAIKLLSTCCPPNNQALYGFIDKNSALLDVAQCRSVIRLVTWPVRDDSTRFADTLAWVALQHFPEATEIQRMWIRWIDNGIFDGKHDNPEGLAYYMSEANKKHLLAWAPINDALRKHVRKCFRSGDKEKVNVALGHVKAIAGKGSPVLNLLLQEATTGTAEWDCWDKRDPKMAELMRWIVHFTCIEALGDRDWLRAKYKAKEMVDNDND